MTVCHFTNFFFTGNGWSLLFYRSVRSPDQNVTKKLSCYKTTPAVLFIAEYHVAIIYVRQFGSPQSTATQTGSRQQAAGTDTLTNG